MKKRTMIGGLVVAGIVLGTLISGKIPGFGSGTGIANEAPGTAPKAVETSEKPKDDSAIPKDEPVPAPVATVEKPAQKKPDEPKETPEPLDFIDIMVDTSNYSVSRGGVGNYRDLTLSQILTLAKMTTGNDDGLRVRILRKKTAKYLSYATLRSELVAAGVEADSIRMPHDLVD